MCTGLTVLRVWALCGQITVLVVLVALSNVGVLGVNIVSKPCCLPPLIAYHLVQGVLRQASRSHLRFLFREHQLLF